VEVERIRLSYRPPDSKLKFMEDKETLAALEFKDK